MKAGAAFGVEVKSKVTVKKFGGHPLTGGMLATILELWVEEINKSIEKVKSAHRFSEEINKSFEKVKSAHRCSEVCLCMSGGGPAA